MFGRFPFHSERTFDDELELFFSRNYRLLIHQRCVVVVGGSCSPGRKVLVTVPQYQPSRWPTHAAKSTVLPVAASSLHVSAGGALT